MKKTLISLALAAVLTLSLCLSSCGAKLEYKNGVYYCAKNGVSYVAVDLRYYSVTIGEKYATLKDAVEEDLYEMKDISPERWLTTKGGDLFCAVGEKVPALSEMGVDTVTICAVGNAATLALAEVRNKETVKYVLDSYLDGTALTYPDTTEVSESLMLRFWAEEYAWLYYNLSYVEFATDVKVSDYPASLSDYTYREVDDSVVVTVLDEFECRYKVESDSERKRYEAMATDAGIDYYTVTKPSGSGTETFVVFVYNALESKAECIEYFISHYEGNMKESELREALGTPVLNEKVTRVEYNYGKYFIYDRISGRCVKVDDTLHKYRNYEISD